MSEAAGHGYAAGVGFWSNVECGSMTWMETERDVRQPGDCSEDTYFTDLDWFSNGGGDHHHQSRAPRCALGGERHRVSGLGPSIFG